MNEFAVVSEGATDYAVLKNILVGWFKDQSAEPFLKPYQPDPTADGVSSWQQFGTWENVIRYLQGKKHRDALEFAEYLIVQIDTDQSEHVNFGVPQREDDRQLDPHTMVERVVAKLREIIGTEDLTFYEDRIIFAICVREVECWLLPLWDESRADKSTGCLKAIDLALRKADEHILSTEPKDARLYDQASKEYRKRKVLLAKGPLNPSLAIFLDELERRHITLSDG
ncbi:MAG: hypothetical protein NTW21_04320 [Verrucomicrobia bacterium]|nr:hypothetical protein [Verrucomicrobiota bacterium]